MVQIGSDAERALHGNQKTVLEGGTAAIEIGDVGDPGHHHLRGIGVGEAFLDAEAVKGFGSCRFAFVN